MNSYYIDVSETDANVSAMSGFLQAFYIGNVLGKNFDTLLKFVDVAGANVLSTSFRFDLPFSLSNISRPDMMGKEYLYQTAYDTRYQEVKEFLDKPYCVAGRSVVLMIDSDTILTDVERDMDDFIRYQVVVGATKYTVYFGRANSTLTQAYQPFGIVGGVLPVGLIAIKFFDYADTVMAIRQENTRSLTTAPLATPTLGSQLIPRSNLLNP